MIQCIILCKQTCLIAINYIYILQVKEENPLLFRKFTAIIKKLSFAEIIRPCMLLSFLYSVLYKFCCKTYCLFFTDDERHDVYLTLLQGVFSKGSKRADKNVEVVVEMLGDDDNTLTTVSLLSHDCHMINFRNVSNLELERIMFLCTHHLSIIIWPHLFLMRQSRYIAHTIIIKQY